MKKAFGAMLGLVLVGALGAVAFWYLTDSRLTEFAAQSFGTAEAKVVEIPTGTNPRGVANLLAESGAVSDGELFYRWLRREKLGQKLKAGEYEFAGPMTPRQVADKVISGQVKQYHFPVPEGLRADEILYLRSSRDEGITSLADLAEIPAFQDEPDMLQYVASIMGTRSSVYASPTPQGR